MQYPFHEEGDGMRYRQLIFGCVLGSVCALLGANALSQDEAGRHGGTDEELMADMMEQWRQVASPGEHHAILERFVGEWTFTNRLWMAGPDAPPEETNGTATFTSILGGRYVQSAYTGTLLEMPMDGIGLYGYDNFKNKYTLCWVDNLSTHMTYAEGLLDGTETQITFFGSMDEWMTGEHDKPVKYVYRFVDADRIEFEINDLGIIPGETKVVEVIYERAKK
jgi:hypothetical protein